MMRLWQSGKGLWNGLKKFLHKADATMLKLLLSISAILVYIHSSF